MPDRRESVPFARYVPASAEFFVTVRRLGKANEALHQARAWRLLPLLAGGAATDAGKPFDLRGAITSFLGPHVSIDVEELLQSEVGVVAPSWSELGSAVWLIRIADEATLDRWFPVNRRVGAAAARGVRSFRTRDGMIVCESEGIIAMSRRWRDNSLLRETMRLMVGDNADVLDRDEVFRGLIAYLPYDYLAVAYWARDDETAAGAVKLSPWWPALDRAVIALYEGEGRIDVAIRASLAVPRRKPRLSHVAVERLLRLPQTTLYASTTAIDFAQAYKTATAQPSQGMLGRYLTLLAAMQGRGAAATDTEPLLGPHVVFAWGQDLSEAGLAPQAAVMIECSDTRAVRERAMQFASKMIKLLRMVDPGGTPNDLRIEERRHLGVPIMYVPLEARAQTTRLPFVKVLANLQPAWAVWNGWVIIALSHDHIEHIIDAQFGLTPTLAVVRDVRDLRERLAGWTVLSFVQPGLATDVLDRWLSAYKAGSPSLLDPSWWQRQTQAPPARPPRLGIGMKIVQEPGVVVVRRVYPNTPAQERLAAGDRILGIDGGLLSLSSPNADLRRRWAASSAEPGPILRVQRGGEVTEVVLPKRNEVTASSPVRITPADAVRELASLGRTLQFASFAVRASDERYYSARLSLRFAPAHVTNASTDH